MPRLAETLEQIGGQLGISALSSMVCRALNRVLLIMINCTPTPAAFDKLYIRLKHLRKLVRDLALVARIFIQFM